MCVKRQKILYYSIYMLIMTEYIFIQYNDNDLYVFLIMHLISIYMHGHSKKSFNYVAGIGVNKKSFTKKNGK